MTNVGSTKVVRVYHARPEFQAPSGDGPSTFFRCFYEFVAKVEGDDSDEAFRLTNHIDRDWTENPGVQAAPGRHRSTSVGDVLVMPDGRHLYIAAVGFKEIPTSEPERPIEHCEMIGCDWTPEHGSFLDLAEHLLSNAHMLTAEEVDWVLDQAFGMRLMEVQP